MILSFRCPETAKLFRRQRVRKLPPGIQQRAYSKLNQIDAAVLIDDLRLPPSNRLEALKGHRAGEHSIRINEQWRVCFIWTNAGVTQVEIVDYH